MAKTRGKRDAAAVATSLASRNGHQAPKNYDDSKFPKPSATCDTVILTLVEGELRVLAIQRKKMPYEGFWALPGGFVNKDEDLDVAALRELHEETGLDRIHFEQVGAYGAPGRDPRGWVITVAYVALASWDKLQHAKAGDDAREVGWFPVSGRKSPDFAFDHRLILDDALAHVRQRVLHTAIAKPMLPTSFKFADLKAVYEKILGGALDSRKLKRDLLARGVIGATGKATGRNQLYTFKNIFWS